MLFDTSAYRVHLPENVRVFASGANRVAEIEGFARVGIPIGVSVCELNEEAIRTLIEIDNPVLIDSGAFSEVVFLASSPLLLEETTKAPMLWLIRELRPDSMAKASTA